MAVRRSPLVGVFNDRASADNAIAQLRDAGFSDNQISYSSSTAGTGNGGFLEGLKNFFTGDQTTTSSSAVANDLSNMGLSDDEAHYYASEHDAGHTVVAVHPGNRYEDALSILRSNGAYNRYQAGAASTQGTAYDQTTTGYNQAAGYDPNVRTSATGYDQAAGYDPNVGAAPATGYNQRTADYDQTADYDRTADTDVTDEARRIRLREERLQADKQRVQSGEVRLGKDVVEEQRNIDVPVTHEEVYVEHRPFREGQLTDAPVGQDETIRVPVSEEQVNVTKNTVETGEVNIGKRKVQETQRVSDTVRREEPRLERDGNPNIHSNIERDDVTDTDPNV